MNLHPPSTLVMGPAGVGKTTSLVTLLEANLKVRMLATEPTAPNRVLEECAKRKIDASQFHWTHVSPSPASWQSLIEAANIINSMTLKDIADMRSGIARPDSKQWITFLNAIANFKSDRDGTVFGDATSWGSDVAFVIDGLSGVNTMSRNLTVGLKPNPSPGEWGVMQGNILNLIKKLCGDCLCFFVLIAHVERETNEITGVNNLTVATLGAKLAPKIPPEFTNVVYAKRVGTSFVWSTADTGVDTKNGDLPLSDGLAPSFAPIVESYRRRVESAAGTASPQPVALVR